MRIMNRKLVAIFSFVYEFRINAIIGQNIDVIRLYRVQYETRKKYKIIIIYGNGMA